jgi:hypothetical protein
MNALSSMIVPLALIAASTATASSAPAQNEIRFSVADDMQAQITAVDLEKSTFSVKIEGREVSLTYDERTQFMLDGEKSSAARVLAVGRNVSVTHAGGKASKVEAKSALAFVDDMQAQITAVDLEKSTFSVKIEGREVSLTYDERTQFMLDGEKSSAARVLAVGREVSVTHAGGKASKVEAKSK